jgi:hypothetical protein
MEASASAIAAFQALWEQFPEPAWLVRRDRTVLAANALGREAGLMPGAKCHSLDRAGGDHPCPGCLLEVALGSGEPVVREEAGPGEPLRSCWLPVAGELFIRYGLGTVARFWNAIEAGAVEPVSAPSVLVRR